jgi:thiol-disulfide isomerase/thioredoxin
MNFSKVLVLLTVPLFSFLPKTSIKHLETSSAAAIAAEDNSTLLPIGTIAPEWELQNSEGKKRKLSDFKGKIVVMDFWATWCAPCIQSQPNFQALHENHKDIVVLGMDFNDQENIDLNKYKLRKKLGYEMILNAEKIGAIYKVAGLPTVYVIDQSGKIAYSSMGYSEKTENELAAFILMESN